MNKLRTLRALIGMSVIVSILCFFSISMASVSQWAKSYGRSSDDRANSIQQTTDDGYIVAGETTSFFGYGGRDAWVLKLDSNGDVQWQKIYGSSTSEHYANSIQRTPDGGYIVAGDTRPFGNAWVLKLDVNGNVQWQKTYGSGCAKSIQQTTEGGYVVVGMTSSFGAGRSDVWVLKLDVNGDVLWQKTFGGTSYDEAYSIQQTTDGGYVVAATTESYPGYDARVLKLDGNGNVQWQKTFYGGGSNHVACSVQQTTDGGYVVAGYGGDPIEGKWVLKLDGNGNVQWQKIYGGGSANSIKQTTDGGYIVGGSFCCDASGGKDQVLKLDGNGNVQWQKTYRNSGGVTSIQQATDGGYVVAGMYRLLKLDGNGNIYNCSIVETSNEQTIDTYETIVDINVIVGDSHVFPQTGTASMSDANVVVTELCIYGCNLVPDATVIPRGGTLGFRGTITNNTNKTGSVLFATGVTLPNGNWYPPSGYLIRPFNIYSGPYQSKSGRRSHVVPLTAPLGTYTYHGYVGNYGVGIYDECWFNFEVTQ